MAAHPPRPAAATSCDTERGRPSDKPPPPGQLKRRGVVGNIVGVDAESGTIIIEMKFGTVEMTVPEDFELTEDMIGSRVAGLLEKEVSPEDIPSDETDATADEPATADQADEGGDGEGEGDGDGEDEVEEGGDASEEPLQSGSLLKLKLVPAGSTRTHETAVVTSQDDGTVQVLDESGNAQTLEVEGEGTVQVVVEDGEPSAAEGEDAAQADAGTDYGGATPPADPGDAGDDVADGGTGADGDAAVEQYATVVEDIEDGTDVVLLVQCTGPDAEPKVRGMQKADRVAERLERHEAKIAERDTERAEKAAERIQEREQRREERLERTAANAPQGLKDKADRALGKAMGEIEESGRGRPKDSADDDQGDKGRPEDKGNDKGKDKDDGVADDGSPDDADGGGGSSGDNQGGGGGPPEDAGGGGGRGKNK